MDSWIELKNSSAKTLSENTEAAYRRDLQLWALYVADLLGRPEPEGADPQRSAPAGALELQRIKVGDLLPEVVHEAFLGLERDGYSLATRARMIGTLKAFCGFLMRRGHLKADPTDGLATPAPATTLPQTFSPQELRRLVRVASSPDPGARAGWPQRDRAMIAVLAGTGITASEAIGLQVKDVLVKTPDGPQLRVRGTGAKARRIPLPGQVADAVTRYLADREKRMGRYRQGDALLVNDSGKPLSRAVLNWHVDRWCTRADIKRPRGAVAHAFRHTYATTLVRAGVALPEVQKLLGHNDLKTTSVYLQMPEVQSTQSAALSRASRALGAALSPSAR